MLCLQEDFWPKIKIKQGISDCNGTRTHNHLVCKQTLNRLAKLTNTYAFGQTDQYLQYLRSSIIWSVWPNGSVFAYKLSGCGFESRRSHSIFRYHTCFEQGVPWHSGKYRVWIHSEMRMWHDKNIQSKARYTWELMEEFKSLLNNLPLLWVTPQKHTFVKQKSRCFLEQNCFSLKKKTCLLY